MSSWLSWLVCMFGLAAASWARIHQRSRSISPWYWLVWARITSPERGSTTSPPELAERTGETT